MTAISVRRYRDGFVLEYGEMRIGLDVGIANGPMLLSHSHSDHTRSVRSAREIIATRGTLDTLAARGGRVNSRTTVVETSSTIFHDDVMITVLNAGHVLGSSMFLIDFGEKQRVLYTGDFNTVDSYVHVRALPIDADVLIMEATYGSPEWTFPQREIVYDKIIKVARETLDNGMIPRFHAYSLGKAQEVIALLQNAGFNVVTGNGSIDRVSRVYTRHGIDLSFHPLSSQEARRLLEGECVVVTSSSRHMFYNLVKALGSNLAKQFDAKMVDYNLSGWTLSDYGNGALPLSAHTDYPGLIEFAKQVNPVITYCFTDNARILAEGLSQEGITAIPLE